MKVTINMRTIRTLALVMLWPICSYFNTGFVLADCYHAWGEHGDLQRKHFREDVGFAAVISLIPPTWFLTPFLTGFYQHGWMRPSLRPPEEKK